MENLEKGGVIENEILFDNDDVLHIFWNTLMGLARTHISNIILIQKLHNILLNKIDFNILHILHSTTI